MTARSTAPEQKIPTAVPERGGAPYAIYVMLGTFLVVSLVIWLFTWSRQNLQQQMVPAPEASPSASENSETLDDLEVEVNTIDLNELENDLESLNE